MEKEKIDFEKLKTSELLDIVNKVSDTQLDDFFEALYDRIPINSILEDINGLRSDVDEIKRLLRSHKHISNGKAVKEIDI